MSEPNSEILYDVAIIGSGPAGYTAAITSVKGISFCANFSDWLRMIFSREPRGRLGKSLEMV